VRGIVGVTGTPGTGKKSVAPLVARGLGIPVVALNSLVGGKEEVDPIELHKALLRDKTGRSIVFGHLFPHALRKREVSFVAVLRCEPSILRDRLVRRRYPLLQLTANVEAELIGLVLDECLRAFGADLVHEYDTSSSAPSTIASAICCDVEAAGEGRGTRKKRAAWIDWTVRYDTSGKLRSLFDGT
jgi:adenylate kinase